MLRTWSGLTLPVRSVALALATTAFLLIARWTEGFELGPIFCPLRLMIGAPCPFCGTTRSLGSLIQGDLQASLSFNPLGVICAGFVLALFLIPEKVTRWSNYFSAILVELSTTKRAILVSAPMVFLWILNIPRMV